MKRLTAIVLILTLLCASSALASSVAPTDKLEERMLLQYGKSGFYADVTVDIKGDGVEYIDAPTWALLKTFLPGAKIGYESTIRQNNRETVVTLSKDDSALAMVTALENGDMTLVKSNLIDAADSDLWYGAPASYNLADLIAYAREGEDASWPSLLGVVWSVANASEEWQGRAGVYMNTYLTDLGVWMQRFTKVSIVPLAGGTSCTEMLCVIPTSEVKNELKSLLAKLYADNALMTILREVLSADEAAAYLEPSMLSAFTQMIDALEIGGDVTVLRRFNLQGQAILESISLPFAAGQPISSLAFSTETTESGERYDMEIALPKENELPGSMIRLNAVKDAEGAYTGDLVLTLPTARDAYTVVDDATYDLAYTYYFFCDAPDQTYDYETDRATRAIDVMLALTPAEGNDGHRHSLTLHADFSSRASNLTPTRLTASLSLMDLTTDGGLTVSLAARTAVAWTPERTVAQVPANSVTRIDQLQGTALGALLTTWQQNMALKFATLISGVLPYTVVDDDSVNP